MTLIVLATLMTLGAAPAASDVASAAKLQSLERDWQNIRDHQASAHSSTCIPEPVDARVRRLVDGFTELTQQAHGETLEKALIRVGDLNWFLAKLAKNAKVPPEIAKLGPAAISNFKDDQGREATDDRQDAVDAWTKAVEMADKADQRDLEIDRIKAQLRMMSPESE